MNILKELDTFFTKTIPNVATKEIPKFVTKTVPSVFDRDTYAPDLPPLRKEVDALAKRVENRRETFFTTQRKLQRAHERYQKLAEDYNRSQADVALSLRVPTHGAEKLSQELEGMAKTLKDIGQVSRTVLGVTTIGLAELGFMHADNAEERDQLVSRKASLTALLKRYDVAIAKIARAQADVDAKIVKVEDALRSLGIEESDDAASQLTEVEEAKTAKRELAAKLLTDGISIEGISLITGLTAADISEITPDTTDPLPPVQDASLFTEDEVAMIQEVKGKSHVV